MKIKMIGLDLDGTLLDSQKRVSTYTDRVLRQAINQGIEIVIATGRSLCGIPKQLLELPGLRYVIVLNGARVIDLQKNEVIYEKRLEKRNAQEVFRIFKDYDTTRDISLAGRGYMESSQLQEIEQYVLSEALGSYIKESRLPANNIEEMLANTEESIDKVHAFFKFEQERQEAWKRIEKIDGVEVSGSLGNNIEVNAKGVNKGRGLLGLGELIGIHQEEIMAVGDELNDIEMVRMAGLGVAMENGHQEIKKHAEYITDTNDKDGAAKAIIKLACEEE